jgi:hypothetical protein
MTDHRSNERVYHGETIDVHGNGEEISPPTNSTKRRKLIDDDDNEEPMSIEVKVRLCIVLSIMFLIMFGFLFFTWWCCAEYFVKAVLSRMPRREPATLAPVRFRQPLE